MWERSENGQMIRSAPGLAASIAALTRYPSDLPGQVRQRRGQAIMSRIVSA